MLGLGVDSALMSNETELFFCTRASLLTSHLTWISYLVCLAQITEVSRRPTGRGRT